MAYGRITQTQSEILEYIKSQILNKGYPPSVRDICQAVNLKSTSSVHAHLESLEKNGYIRRDPTKSRTIEIIDDNFNLTRREVVNIPLLGQVAAGQPLLAVENITEYFPIPSEYCAQVGEDAKKFVVPQTPISVPIITSFLLSGFINMVLTGISGRFPSLFCQVAPPSWV